MKDYTAIGSMLYGTGGESFKRGILGGVSRTLKAGNSNTTIVLIREITEHEEGTEVHPGVEVQPERLGVPDGGGKSLPCRGAAPWNGTKDSRDK